MNLTVIRKYHTFACKKVNNMSKIVPELNYLLAEVEKHYGRKLLSSTDFEALSIVIEHECGEILSSSTLKRLWGYVSLKPIPRISTLNVLSKFIGMRDFEAFRQSIKNNQSYVSRYFSTKTVCSSDLDKGAEMIIGWAPDRLVHLKYDGGSTYTVTKSENSKLIEGDSFSAESFMLGYPLYIPRILRNGEYTLSYIAGTQDGLNRIDVIG